MQCVPYAREQSGIQIRGDAHTWWDKAAATYQRGSEPRPGAVLVLKRTSKMTEGHLAVVNNIEDDRHMMVRHTNWGNDHESRSILYKSMLVEDVSANNDWSSVRFWNYEQDCFGFPYAVQGFIYP